jgi:hypothetical protein
MEPDASDSEASVESEFTTTARYLELYMRQKTDLYLQHYLFFYKTIVLQTPTAPEMMNRGKT